ncbi:MAG: toprim domain-containing protein [Bosea sp.]|uniref:DUF5906 domain-containing protein n=1 Tax=unclassified Bosea (in: a-proteobacteria) TaxID=2653178 RepID=UPI0009660AA4|nr:MULTISPECIES: DUF5906 domain-containing protein [unclassified Bosea (in: a-proteobacteria)]MBN9457381.1 toprim domain-containing protein [Bosea sp. (in: a-proteobacteria)]OJV09633.1 MAG: hypothetical protein BGO20_02915 [Bosea sp. 67-29]
MTAHLPATERAWADFLGAMASCGIRTKDKIEPSSKIIRFHVEGDKKGTKNGWLTFHEDHPASGAFGSYKLGRSETWTVDKPERMSPQDRAEIQRRMAETRRQREEEQARAHAACRAAAAAIVAATEPARQDHPYLVKKNLNVTAGLRQLARDVKYEVTDEEKPQRTARKGALVIPIYGPDKTLHSVQTIDGQGRKHFIYGTNKKGNYWSIGKLTKRIIIGEGYSTCATVHAATGCCTVIAFDSGNLPAVAKAIRAKYPDHEIVLAADNDRFTMEPVPNPGMTKACEAAAEVAGLVAWPEFDDGATLDDGGTPTDFNDLAAVRKNLESVAAAFAAAVPPHDIENHADPRRERPAPQASAAPIPLSAPFRAEISEAAVRALRARGFEWGSEVEVAGAFCQAAARSLGSLIYSEGHFWTFNSRHWERLDDQALRRALHILDGAEIDPMGKASKLLKLSSRMIDGVLREMSVMTGDATFFENPAPGVPARNGLVQFACDGRVTLVPHAPEHRRRFVVDADFEPIVTPYEPPGGSLLERLFAGSFKGDHDAHEKVSLIAETLGAAAAGLATQIGHPKALLLYGACAGNGKSAIAALFSALLPANAVCSISPADMNDKTMIVGLAGCAANVADELGGKAIAGDIFKRAVTGETVPGRDVYKPKMEFKPVAQHVFTTNSLPDFAGGFDRGLQRRFMVVEFSRPIPAAEIVPNIAERIAREELEALLGFAVTGASRLVKRGGFSVPASSKAALDTWLRSDPLQQWSEFHLQSTSEPPPGGWPKTRELFESCRRWMLNEGYRESSVPAPNVFTQRLRSMKLIRDTVRRSDGARAIGVTLASAR